MPVSSFFFMFLTADVFVHGLCNSPDQVVLIKIKECLIRALWPASPVSMVYGFPDPAQFRCP